MPGDTATSETVLALLKPVAASHWLGSFLSKAKRELKLPSALLLTAGK